MSFITDAFSFYSDTAEQLYFYFAESLSFTDHHNHSKTEGSMLPHGRGQKQVACSVIRCELGGQYDIGYLLSERQPLFQFWMKIGR